jgi:hypothetical protein
MRTGEYKELIEDIKDITKNLTIVEGIVDIHLYTGIAYPPTNKKNYEVKDAKNSFWILIGHAEEEEIKECIEDFTFKSDMVQCEGEYHFNAVLKYEKDDGYRGYWYIDYMEVNLQQTFLEREREEKLFNLFKEDLDIFS